jgi:hypothetical protein
MVAIDKSQLISGVGKIHHGADGLDTELVIPMTVGEGLETGTQFELRITEDAARQLLSFSKNGLAYRSPIAAQFASARQVLTADPGNDRWGHSERWRRSVRPLR